MAKKVLGRGLGVYFPEYQSDEEKSTENTREPIAKQGNKEKENKEIDTAELVLSLIHI